jgi:hypothetical protein
MFAKIRQGAMAALDLAGKAKKKKNKPEAAPQKAYIADLDLDTPADAFEALRRVALAARQGEALVLVERRHHTPPHQRHLKKSVTSALSIYAIH